jgi:hypothetical protein
VISEEDFYTHPHVLQHHPLRSKHRARRHVAPVLQASEARGHGSFGNDTRARFGASVSVINQNTNEWAEIEES